MVMTSVPLGGHSLIYDLTGIWRQNVDGIIIMSQILHANEVSVDAWFIYSIFISVLPASPLPACPLSGGKVSAGHSISLNPSTPSLKRKSLFLQLHTTAFLPYMQCLGLMPSSHTCSVLASCLPPIHAVPGPHAFLPYMQCLGLMDLLI